MENLQDIAGLAKHGQAKCVAAAEVAAKLAAPKDAPPEEFEHAAGDFGKALRHLRLADAARSVRAAAVHALEAGRAAARFLSRVKGISMGLAEAKVADAMGAVLEPESEPKPESEED